jgi:hypothetical protein
MFDRLQKPFLTVETGEAYQPIRISYFVQDTELLLAAFAKMSCLVKNSSAESWSWHWHHECAELHFETLESYRSNPDHPLRLGTLVLRKNSLYLTLPSYKRACLAVPFFHENFSDHMTVRSADFINKVFGVDERLPHGFSEIFKEEELDHLLNQRITDYYSVKEKCENAESAEQALALLAEYSNTEAKKRLPYAERYAFDLNNDSDLEMVFMGFYLFLRSRELVAIKRWFGETGYSLADAADYMVQEVFGDADLNMNLMK